MDADPACIRSSMSAWLSDGPAGTIPRGASSPSLHLSPRRSLWPSARATRTSTPASRPRRRCRSTNGAPRGARAARRPLHGGPGVGSRRDGAGHAARRDRRGVRLGLRERSRADLDVLARRPRSRARRARGGTPRGRPSGHLLELFTAAGLVDVEGGVVETHVDHAAFSEWWEPFTLGVGPAGAFASTLETEVLETVRARCEVRGAVRGAPSASALRDHGCGMGRSRSRQPVGEPLTLLVAVGPVTVGVGVDVPSPSSPCVAKYQIATPITISTINATRSPPPPPRPPPPRRPNRRPRGP